MKVYIRRVKLLVGLVTTLLILTDCFSVSIFVWVYGTIARSSYLLINAIDTTTLRCQRLPCIWVQKKVEPSFWFISVNFFKTWKKGTWECSTVKVILRNILILVIVLYRLCKIARCLLRVSCQNHGMCNHFRSTYNGISSTLFIFYYTAEFWIIITMQKTKVIMSSK